MYRLLAALLAVTALPGGAFAQESVTGRYKTSFYGHFKTDAVFDTHGMDGNDYSYYVVSDKASDRDFRISSKGTRLGADISDGDRITAKIEADFQGDDTANAGLRMRHAYVALKAGRFDILSGQTWHLTPLEFSGTNNEFALGHSGALWMRAPQLRVTYRHSDSLTLAAAMVRPTRKLTDNEGTASGLPQAQAQVRLKTGGATFTLMGAYGKWHNTADGRMAEVQLADFGFNLPLGAALVLNGQLWAGQNLYDFLGGAGNVNQYGPAALKSAGGFVNLAVKPGGRLSYNAAYGVDNPEDARLPAAAASKTKFSTLLANATVMIHGTISATLEAARQVTDYKLASGPASYDNMHYQLSFRFPF